MKKKRIIIIIILLIILIILIIPFLSKSPKRKITFSKLEQEIINNNKNKKDMLIYLYTESEEECIVCKEITPIVKNYDKYYNLNIIYYNKDETTKEIYKELAKKTGLNEIDMTLPTLISFKDGLYYTMNDIFSESGVYEFFITNNIIKENKYNNLIDTTEKFKQVYASNENKIIIFYNNDEKSYNFRNNVYNFSKEYNFEVYNLINGSGDTLEANLTLTNYLDETVNGLPVLFVVKNNKVIDYTDEYATNKIKKFLKKYNFVK